MSTIREALQQAQARLEALPHSDASLEAAVLLCRVLDKPRSHLIAWPENELTQPQLLAYETLIQRRRSGEPLAYITGEREFWSLNLRVTPDTLIPRPDTELLVERALARLDPGTTARVADLGTGSGAIALALCRERPGLRIDATDRISAALEVARENARGLGCTRIDFHPGDWCQALPEGAVYHLLLSNPPYIEAGDPHLSQGDLPREPLNALVSGADGLDDIRQIVRQAPGRLQPGGWLILEHGYRQAEAVQACLLAVGLESVTSHRDLAGQPRVTEGRWPG
ncbi:MAG: peptide chain release factor N(5)-glutamine methyltransferase [Candidatus Thiodiazotropha sp.]